MKKLLFVLGLLVKRIYTRYFMKPVSLFLSICILLLVSETTFAQVAADYYLPLRVGNYLELHRQGNQEGWDKRITRYTIEGSDSISGQLYFREKATETPSNDPSIIDVFHVFWLREDSEGNILIGAMGSTGEYWTSNVDSATVIDPPGPVFPNEFLVLGNVREFSWEDFSAEQTTMSNTETVQVPAGTFTNCIKLREIHRDNVSGDVVFLDYCYYAHGIGLVKYVREIPQAYTEELVQYNAVTTAVGQNELAGPTGFSLSQNYPNPFNPVTVIKYSIKDAGMVSLKVYDILGQEVATLVNNAQTPGLYEVEFNAQNLTSGIYFYRLTVGSFSETKKLLFLK